MFKHERRPDESLLIYRRSDKYSLLRQFALSAAESSGNFSDFTRHDLDQFAADLTPSLEAVDDPSAIITEITDHSGLLIPVGHGDLWHFSHRSIQEFLTAEELRLRGDGDEFLLDKADDLNWWQAIQFYTAGQEARQVDSFIRDLAKRNSELATHCLQAAKPSDAAAHAALRALEPITDARVGALAAASRSPRTSIQTMAVEVLKRFLTESEVTFFAMGTGAEGMLPLLESIASTNAAEIAALVPQIIENLPDDPRLVGPLWQCLNTSGIEVRKAQCSIIVQRLLMLVMDPNSFAELERQDSHDRDFLTPIRLQAYPFKNALSPDNNLITLLAWADYLGVTPTEPNRFFHAKAEGRLSRIETDRRRTISCSLFLPARILSSVELLAVLPAAVAAIITDPQLQQRGDTALPLLVFGVMLVPISSLALIVMANDFPRNSKIRYYCGSGDSNNAGGSVIKIFLDRFNPPVSLCIAFTFILAFLFAFASSPLAERSYAVYAIVGLASQLFFWSSLMNVFNSNRWYYLYRPNKYVNVYDDPRSSHWLVSGGGPGL